MISSMAYRGRDAQVAATTELWHAFKNESHAPDMTFEAQTNHRLAMVVTGHGLE
jgi:hypothetical protein